MTDLSAILSPARSRSQVAGNSRKRIFEEVAELLAQDQPELDTADLISSLLAREKLGSTGLGRGIAIPHCRLDKCEQPLGVLMSLSTPVDFDAPDDEPVDILCVLVVPGEAHREHLEILATLAGLFSQDDLCSALRTCETGDEMFQTIADWSR